MVGVHEQTSRPHSSRSSGTKKGPGVEVCHVKAYIYSSNTAWDVGQCLASVDHVDQSKVPCLCTDALHGIVEVLQDVLQCLRATATGAPRGAPRRSTRHASARSATRGRRKEALESPCVVMNLYYAPKSRAFPFDPGSLLDTRPESTEKTAWLVLGDSKIFQALHQPGSSNHFCRTGLAGFIVGRPSSYW